MRRRLSIAAIALGVFGGATLAPNPLAEAERLAEEAGSMAAARPAAALAQARRALALGADFEPTSFVKAGRKGEVVEDAYVAAREEYRRHRAKLYEAVGLCLAAGGQNAAALRYRRRACLLDPQPDRVFALARALVGLGQGPAALEALEKTGGAAAGLPTSALSLLEQAVDLAGLPSAQVELDRSRLLALSPGPVEFRDGPFPLPEGTRLSTLPVFHLEEAERNVLYVAEPYCRNCSADLEALKRAVGPGVRVLVVPEQPDQDQALRQVLALYRYNWPLVLGRGVASGLRLAARSVLVVARGGWAGAALKPPPGSVLASVLAVFEKADVRETVPRPTWNHRPVVRRPPAPPPGLLAEGLAPGEDEPAPEGFAAAVDAYRAGRPGEALRLFEALEAKGDGWLLPPEARLDRALCLAALGRREEARRLLLRTGDSRFQDAVDRALEKVGSK
jgi:tetratricopeptide (TPR) repeat protein